MKLEEVQLENEQLEFQVLEIEVQKEEVSDQHQNVFLLTMPFPLPHLHITST